MNMKITLTTILLIAVAVLVVLQFKSCFDKTPPNEKIIRSDMKIEQLEKQRIVDSIALSEARNKYDSLIADVLDDKKFQSQYQPLKKTYEKIPRIVNDFDREQLRRAVANY